MLSSAKSSTNGHRAHDGWLEFVRAVYLCRHFGKALERHAQEETVDCINKILRICDGGDLFEGQKKTVTLLGFSPSTTTSSQTKSMHTFIHAGTELAYENGVSSTDDLDQVLGLVLQVSASFCAGMPEVRAKYYVLHVFSESVSTTRENLYSRKLCNSRFR